jgi:hypothetical protein
MGLIILALVAGFIWYKFFLNKEQQKEVKESWEKGNNAAIATTWVVADVAEENSLKWKVKRLEAKLKQQGKGGE